MAGKSPEKKRNVAIIGGGTGLTTAWGLENQDKFNVTVFEASDRLGGHIHSMNLNGVIVEGGAEFIGSPDVYTNVHLLLKYLSVALDKFQLNMDFNNLKEDDHTVLPPVYDTSSGKDSSKRRSFLNYCGLFGHKGKQNETHISWHTMVTELCTLINLNNAIKHAKKKLVKPDEMITLEQFVNNFINDGPIFLNHRRDFADNFLYPLIAAGWGVSIDRIKTFGAHYAMQYLEADLGWYDAPDGLSDYINRMQAQCTNTSFQLNTPIKKIIPVEVNGELKYQLQKQDDSFVLDESGDPAFYDDLVISTPGEVTTRLISDIENEELRELCEKLAKVTYYDTTVVFHQDPKYLSENNTVVHSRFDGTQAANTMCKPWKYPEGEVPIMKTWVLPGQPKPENILYEAHYRHPAMDRNYYEAQITLHKMQGKTGIWYGGILAGFNDSHESGVTVALEVAARLNQQENTLENNTRLNLFSKVIESIKTVTTLEHDNVSIMAM